MSKGNSLQSVKVYNKTRQLQEKKKLDTDEIVTDTMRVEYTLLDIKKIRAVFGTAGLYEITDKMVVDAYERFVLKTFRTPFEKWRAQNRKELSALVKRYLSCRQKGRRGWWAERLNEFRDMEGDSAVRYPDEIRIGLLDIEDLFEEIRKIPDEHRSRIVKGIKKALISMFTHHDGDRISEILYRLEAAIRASREDEPNGESEKYAEPLKMLAFRSAS